VKLTVNPDGRLSGPASISYNTPFPCLNGAWGSAGISGVLMHTMVGNLPGTIAWFNDLAAQASAQFGIDQAGHIHQFGPIGLGWYAWHAGDANRAWYGIEHADDGNPDNPLTDLQITASAQLVECLSAFAGFPLEVTDTPMSGGYGTHVMGGAAWGGHSCPDQPPMHVRSAQRSRIIEIARSIRGGTPAPVPPPVWQEDAMRALPELRLGAAGADVRTVQGLCNARSAAAALVIDGVFGPATDADVRRVQSAGHVTVDGIVGPETWPVLMGISP